MDDFVQPAPNQWLGGIAPFMDVQVAVAGRARQWRFMPVVKGACRRTG
jgi:hypothetical protein